ncbi:MAG: DUF5671 domain-containing protein [Dehalococcoidales bacterium]|nr:DUF5671 domain-containing protein [Dehalococcoidales bacterium]MDD5498996.1 DUF5671 domain-containing protein [Dehalococcoidales bacterium]
MILSILSLIIPALITIAIVVAIVMATRSKDASATGIEGVSLARHVWLYLLMLISLGIFAAGIGQLLTLLFDITIGSSYISSIGGRSFDMQRLALGLAMTVIGGPLWFLFWNAARRRIIQNPAEAGSIVRKFYLSLLMVITALTFLPTISGFFQWLLSGVPLGRFSSGELATAIVTGVIWFCHWRISTREGRLTPAAKTIHRWYVYILSAFGLVWLASGIIVFITTTTESLPIWGNSFTGSSFWNEATHSAVSQIVFGSVTWYFHWFRMAKGDVASALRQVYFYLFAITGGALLALISATFFLYSTLSWFFGAVSASAGEHFQFLCWTVPAMIVGTAIWTYHRTLAQEEAEKVEERRESARRVYIYLMNFLGLSTTVAGVVMLFGIVLELVISALSTALTPAPGWWREQLAVSLAMLAVGMPLLIYYWNLALKRSRDEAVVEWQALSRRIFLYTVVGIAIIALTAGSVNIVYQVISGVLESTASVEVLRSSRWSLQAVLAATPVLWYFWQVLRADQRHGSEASIAKKDITLLVSDPNNTLSSALQAELGYKIRLLKTEPSPYDVPIIYSDEEIANLAGEIQSTPSEKIMLVAEGGRILLLPYRTE